MKTILLNRVLSIVFTILSFQVFSQQLAFPTAEGFGKNTTGGRGGTLFIVSNLNDSGVGSLREAVQASGTRTVVFSVSGIIRLQSQLTISNGNISILGQSAPGDGICIVNYTVQISASNVLIRYIRFRPGSHQTGEYDASWGRNNKNIIFDHCSFSWGNDEQASFYDNENFTMQYCIISESFYSSTHPKGNHGYGGIWGGWGASFHHNLIANHTSRTPRFCGARYHLATASAEIVDFRNNVIFNWGFNSAYGGEAGNHNMVNNYFKPGSATGTGSVRYRIINPSDAKSDGNPISKWYVSGNYMAGNSNVTADNWNGGVQPSDGNISLSELRANSPMNSAGISTQNALDAYETVLASAGASLVRDAVDLRAINAATTGVTNFGGAFGANKGIVDNESQVGGYPTYNTYNQITDTDKDGMDDSWERTHGMIVGVKDDAGDVNNDGYTNIEEYVNCLVGEGDGCDVVTDCNGDVEGTATLDECGICSGGNTGVSPCFGAIQGEDFCEAIGIQETSNLGFVGTGYVNFDNAIGSSASWYVNSDVTGAKTLGIRYANGGAVARSMSVSVNGSVQKTFTGAVTGAWNAWLIENVSLNLLQGVNQIVLTALAADGGPNVDALGFVNSGLIAGGCTADCNGTVGGSAYVDNCGTCVAGNTGLDACTQDCTGQWGGSVVTDDCGVCLTDLSIQPCTGSMEAEAICDVDGSIDSNNGGFSGTGFVNTTNAQGSFVNWVFNSDIDQTATISFRYANGGTTSRDGEITINGNTAGKLILPPTGSWSTWSVTSVNVDVVRWSNELIVTATSADGLANIDLIGFSGGLLDAQCQITTTHLVDSKSIDLDFYPNPTNDIVYLSKKSNWILYNSLGEQVASGIGDNKINITTYKSGLYLLSVEGERYKIIKK